MINQIPSGPAMAPCSSAVGLILIWQSQQLTRDQEKWAPVFPRDSQKLRANKDKKEERHEPSMFDLSGKVAS